MLNLITSSVMQVQALETSYQGMKGSVKKLSKSERKQVVVVLFYNTFNT